MHTEKNDDTAKIATGSEAVTYYGKLLNPDFNLDDPRRREIYQNVYFYFSGSSKTTLDQKKGLLIQGNLGVGKSILLKVMNHIFHAFRYVKAKNIERELKDKEIGESNVMRSYGYDLKQNLCIDDVGTEESVIHMFKNMVNPMAQILLERYDLFQDSQMYQGGFKTHMTTNLTTGALKDVYGERNWDRFIEMFNVITWQGESLRK